MGELSASKAVREIPVENSVLIVEDDPFSQKLFSHLISQTLRSYQVKIANTFMQAQSLIHDDNSIQLAIIDIFLQGPRLGVELKHQIQSERPDLLVIYTSSVSPAKFKTLAGEIGNPSVYLRKPFAPDECRFLLQNLHLIGKETIYDEF